MDALIKEVDCTIKRINEMYELVDYIEPSNYSNYVSFAKEFNALTIGDALNIENYVSEDVFKDHCMECSYIYNALKEAMEEYAEFDTSLQLLDGEKLSKLHEREWSIKLKDCVLENDSEKILAEILSLIEKLDLENEKGTVRSTFKEIMKDVPQNVPSLVDESKTLYDFVLHTNIKKFLFGTEHLHMSNSYAFSLISSIDIGIELV